MDRGGKDARAPLGRLPILTMRVDCMHTATPRNSPGVTSDQNLEDDPAVAPSDLQDEQLYPHRF
eukprot:114822-Pyramimonas_sp.AAC.1